MPRLLKLAFLGGIAYALWKLLNDGFPYTPKEPVPAPVRPAEPAPSSANGGTSTSSPTKAELYERAQSLGIEGRSKMSKAELERAIRDSD
jgi:hypothetical protein